MPPVFIFIPVNFSVALDLNDHPGGECVDHRSAHTVQTAGNLVGRVAEFAARVQDGVDHARCWDVLCGVDVGRHAAPVVCDADAAVLFHHNINLFAVARQMFVNTVI